MNRWYPVTDHDGKTVNLPSVTTILSVTMEQQTRSKLTQARAKNPFKYQQTTAAAQHRGQAIDSYVKARLTRQTARLDPQYHQFKRHIDPWLTSLLRSNEPIWTDQFVYNLAHRYAGTLDLIYEIPGFGMTVVDVKTTGYKIHPEALESALLQTAAYRAAWNQGRCALRVDAIAAVFITPYGLTAEVRNGEHLEKHTEAFYQRCRCFGSAYSQSLA
ncbi:PD-(D/E)XK nuclease family protein [Leptothoe sp. PORK10 BA2]|uniref:PD-(D/E)XK nuclease family protein n=1 Tax=Leptothoe sp. PORK10 BA2 TaxID=3110254 RepID=UPI002B21DCD3|nr:PD-(D/E)XK nuclease family protein [Leptothoe sp. PORK10 BA2]MEA5465277.1 PD-(D/E)XK nuclease family protein [Leptothoe sp. PORK10 BA2]